MPPRYLAHPRQIGKPLLRRLRRRQEAATSPNEIGAYIWESPFTIRLLIVGNEPLIRDDSTDEERASYYRFRNALVDAFMALPSVYRRNSLRVYANYIAFDTLEEEAIRQEMIAVSLEITRAHLGWDSIDELGRVTESDEFHALNDRYNHRWSLGQR